MSAKQITNSVNKCEVNLILHSLLVIQKVSLLDWPMVKSTVLLKEIETEHETVNQLVTQTAVDLGS